MAAIDFVNVLNETSLPPPGLTYRDLVGDTSNLSLTNTQTKAQKFKPSLSTKLSDLKQKTTAALERYHERMQSSEDSPLRGSHLYSVENPPRCSSLDTEALIAGIAPPGSSDIMGASPIKKPGKFAHTCDMLQRGMRDIGPSSERGISKCKEYIEKSLM